MSVYDVRHAEDHRDALKALHDELETIYRLTDKGRWAEIAVRVRRAKSAVRDRLIEMGCRGL